MYIDKDDLITHFFRVFGIEPIEYRKNVPCLNFLSSGICNITDERCNPSKCNDYKPDKTHKNWRDFMEVYPEITDRILLKLICCVPKTVLNNCTTIKEIKEAVLKDLILCMRKYTAQELKHQIQQVFKGEE